MHLATKLQPDSRTLYTIYILLQGNYIDCDVLLAKSSMDKKRWIQAGRLRTRGSKVSIDCEEIVCISTTLNI